MYGAASLKMANYVYNKAPRDGTVIGVPNSNLLLEPQLKLLSRKGGVVQFDLNRFIWVGTAIQEPQIMWVMRDGPFRSIDDLKRMKAIVGATEVGTDNYTLSLVMNRLFGTRLDIVAGYPGPNEVILAAERGEVQGSIGALSNLTIGKRDWWVAGTARVLVQFGSERNPLLPDVPTAVELAATRADADMLRLIALKFKMARVFFLPPQTPPQRVSALRRAFDETMQDPAFLDQARTVGLDISPIDGDGTARLVAQIQATPVPVVDALRAVIDAPEHR